MSNAQERKTAQSMIEWLQEEYGNQFDFNRIRQAIELMLVNHKRHVLEQYDIAQGLPEVRDTILDELGTVQGDWRASTRSTPGGQYIDPLGSPLARAMEEDRLFPGIANEELMESTGFRPGKSKGAGKLRETDKITKSVFQGDW
jgi:hypothetical protein